MMDDIGQLVITIRILDMKQEIVIHGARLQALTKPDESNIAGTGKIEIGNLMTGIHMTIEGNAYPSVSVGRPEKMDD